MNNPSDDGSEPSALAPSVRQALTPSEPRGPGVSAPPDSAAGIGAVVSSLRFTLSRAGLSRGTKALLKVNQAEGFDCPGCAWPDPSDPSERATAEFCENGARAVADEADRGRVDPAFFARHSVAELAAQSDHWLNRQGRLTHPMILEPGASHYMPISWDEAFRRVAAVIGQQDDPNASLFYTSGRTSNEAAFLYQLFVRALGTNNLPDCSNMCHESSGTGLGESIGIGKGTVTLDDFEKAQAIFVIGQNPGTNHPRMLSALRTAKKAGAKIVTINPLREVGLVRFKHPQKLGDIFGAGTELTDLYLQVQINGDVALLKALQKGVFEREAVDRKFIGTYTRGFSDFEAALEQIQWDELVEQSGVSKAQIDQAADIYAASDATIICWAMGLTQHVNAVANIQEVVNLLLLRGNIGKDGAGACPVRGHSNVQGDRTMGIDHHPKPAFLAKLEENFSFTPPAQEGLDVVRGIEAMQEGRIKVLFALGGNFVSATPDTLATAQALRQTELTVHVSTKLNRAHLVTGKTGMILPCLGRTELDVRGGAEAFVTVENSMGVVHKSRGSLAPASPHLLSEPEIVARLASEVLGPETPVRWNELVSDYDLIRDAIERTIPGFEDFNQRVRQPGGFELPNGPRDRVFPTASGKAEFHSHPLPADLREPGQLLMMTIRSHDQYNTTVYELNDRYRGVTGARRVIFINPEDLAQRDLRAGQKVTIRSHFKGVTRRADDFVTVPYEIPRGCVATYFPEANVLVALDHFADRSYTPASKSVVVTVAAS